MLAALRTQGFNKAQLARALGRHRCTIGREVSRNSTRAGGRYRASTAQERTNGRRSRSRRNSRFTAADFAPVDDLLRRRWSPEQVSGHLARPGLLSISHETIYRHLWRDKRAGGLLYTHLRGARKGRRKRYGSRGRLAGKRMVSERPAEVEARRTPGHREADAVPGAGTKDCVFTLVERKTGLVPVGELADRTKGSFNRRVIRLIRRHAGTFLTVTADDGTQMRGHQQVERLTGARFYCARPCHPRERGSNEHADGLSRQYLPKGGSMAGLTRQRCNAIARTVNTRPRKRLGFRTPLECFHESSASVALQS